MRSHGVFLLCSLGLTACGHPASAPVAPDAAAPTPALAPPARPAGLFAEAHFGRPRVTAATLSQLADRTLPLTLALAFSTGIDATVLATADLARPIDVLVGAEGAQTHVLYVFTPAGVARLREAFSGRYRLTPVRGVGERLDPRDAHTVPAGAAPPPRCAVVPVPGAVPARIVCAMDPDGLAYGARFAAFASQSRAEDIVDGRVEIDGPAARAVLLPRAQRELDAAITQLDAAAAGARRAHEAPPDFGDPEALIARLRTAGPRLAAELADVRAVHAVANVDATGLTVTAELPLVAGGASALARDLAPRTTAPREHPLAARLAPDAYLALAERGTPAQHRALFEAVLDLALGVLGARVPDATAARADLTALLGSVGDEAAVGLAPSAGGDGELVALLAQTDNGTGARAALARIARAPWLRALRLGDSTLVVTPRADGLVLRPAPPRTPARRAPGELPAPTPSVALAVSNGALAIVWAPRVDAALAGLAARAAGTAPALLAAAPPAPLVAAFDPTRAGAAGAGPVTLAYDAVTAPELAGRLRVALPPRAVAALVQLGFSGALGR